MQIFNLVGRSTTDVELKYTPSGTAVATFSVACDRYNAKKLKEEGKQSTDFFNCVAIGKKAEYVANYLKKGKLVEVRGEVNIDIVKKDGSTSYYTKVKCNDVNILEYEKDNRQENAKQNDDFNFGSYNPDDFQAIEDSESIPF